MPAGARPLVLIHVLVFSAARGAALLDGLTCGRELSLVQRTAIVAPRIGEASCQDDTRWQDGRGWGCPSYRTASSSECDTPENYLTDGVSALNACCSCGGGCVDYANWSDRRGNNCAAYVGRDWCTPDGDYGGGFKKRNLGSFEYIADVSPTKACCGCGGGNWRVPGPTTTTTTATELDIEEQVKKVELAGNPVVSNDKTFIHFAGTHNGDGLIEEQGKYYKDMTRPSWAKSFRCNGAECQDCSGHIDCFGTDDTDGFLKVNYTGESGTWTRFGFLMHADCPSGTLMQAKFGFLRLEGGVLRSFWNGIEADSWVPEGDPTFCYPHSPFVPAGDNKMAHGPSGQQIISVKGRELMMLIKNSEPGTGGGREWLLDFAPNSVGAQAHFTYIDFQVRPAFADCEQRQVCLSVFMDYGTSGLALRNSITLKSQCLTGLSMPAEVSGACEAWRQCLSQDISNEMTLLISAVGGEETRALAAVDARSEAKRTDDYSCIHPLNEDIESWDCSCAEGMRSSCVSIEEMEGYSELSCWRAQICSHERICTSWYNEFCLAPDIQAHRTALNDAVVLRSEGVSTRGDPNLSAAAPLRKRLHIQRAQGDSEIGRGLDESLRSKGCQ